jgi:hypothetical protein
MLHRKKLETCLTVIAFTALFVQRLQAGDPSTDKWCMNRITKDNTTSSTEFAVVDNPLKETGTNESDKVLELSHIDQKGSIALNLTRRIGSAADRISDISNYNGLRFKYFILNPPYPSYNARIRMENGMGDVISATWTHSTKQWKTASFAFPKGSQTSWIQISTYYIASGNWNDAFPGMKIYIDDLELFDSQYTGTSLNNTSTGDENIGICGKQMSISNIKTGSIISIYDIFGRKLYSAKAGMETISFTFPETGIYLVALKDRENLIRRKIIVKE